jgi:branched-chain amino acid transport system permease protein
MNTTVRGRTFLEPLPWEVAGVAALAIAGVAAYFIFPDDLGLCGRILAMAFLVLSLDLLVGFCGIVTLGQAAPFGVGAYAAGIAATNGITEPFSLVGIGAIAGAGAGFVSGVILLRAGGLPQLVLSIAALELLHEAANKFAAFTGGSDGLSGIAPDPVFGHFAFDLWGRTAYLFGLALLVVTFGVLRIIARSPFGLLCRAIKADAVRVRALGGAVTSVLLEMFVIAGFVAGIGGALAAIATQVVGLDSLGFERSADALVMLVLGGAGNLYGALLGTVLFMLVQNAVSAASPFHWLALVGALLIVVVLVAPGGLTGTLARLQPLPRARSGA